MNTKRGILCLTFDNMGNAVEVRKGLRAGPDPNDLSMTMGYPRVLELLDALQLKATFFIEGWNVLHYPAAIRELTHRGHEIGLHGWVHETFHALQPMEVERILTDALAAFRLLGIEPQGFRAPGGSRGKHTMAILRKLGIQYDSSFDDEAQSSELQSLDADIPWVPWEWPMIDYFQYFMHPEGPRSPVQSEALWSAELERAAATGSLVTFIFHAFVSGVDPDRLEVVERLLRKAKLDPRLEVLTAGETAKRIKGAAVTGSQTV